MRWARWHRLLPRQWQWRRLLPQHLQLVHCGRLNLRLLLLEMWQWLVVMRRWQLMYRFPLLSWSWKRSSMPGHLWQVMHGVLDELQMAYCWFEDICRRVPDLSGKRARRVMAEKAWQDRRWIWLPFVRLGDFLGLRVPRPGSRNARGRACIS